MCMHHYQVDNQVHKRMLVENLQFDKFLVDFDNCKLKLEEEEEVL